MAIEDPLTGTQRFPWAPWSCPHVWDLLFVWNKTSPSIIYMTKMILEFELSWLSYRLMLSPLKPYPQGSLYIFPYSILEILILHKESKLPCIRAIIPLHVRGRSPPISKFLLLISAFLAYHFAFVRIIMPCMIFSLSLSHPYLSLLSSSHPSPLLFSGLWLWVKSIVMLVYLMHL